MTRTRNARIAGATFLVYIAAVRGRMIPLTLACFTWLVWLPMLVFEVTLALWLLIKGVAMPAQRQPA